MITSSVTNLKDQVLLVLASSPIHSLRAIKVDSKGTQVVLSGRVESFYQKQMAQELVRSISDDLELQNSIEVRVPK